MWEVRAGQSACLLSVKFLSMADDVLFSLPIAKVKPSETTGSVMLIFYRFTSDSPGE